MPGKTTPQTVPDWPMKQLLAEISEHGTRHLAEAETDLSQTVILLDEAIAKLSSSFMALHAAVTAQQEAVQHLIANGVADDMGKLKAASEQIGMHVNASITGLQFQDLTSQLIGRVTKRIAGLRGMLEALGENVAEMRPEGGGEQVSASLHRITDAVAMQSHALESVLLKSVGQRHMESGDIELF